MYMNKSANMAGLEKVAGIDISPSVGFGGLGALIGALGGYGLTSRGYGESDEELRKRRVANAIAGGLGIGTIGALAGAYKGTSGSSKKLTDADMEAFGIHDTSPLDFLDK